MIARTPSLTDQVKSHLKERILEGDFSDGRIPSENELAGELGVSRTTVRDALTRLENDGTIYRKQGAGTFVNEHGLQIKSRLEEIWSYEEVLEDHGYTPSVEVLELKRLAADTQTATQLGIDEGDELLVVIKLFREDETPVILTENRIPAAYVQEDAASFAGIPMYRFMEEHCDRNLSYYLSEIIPVALNTEQSRRLGVKRGTPAMCFEEVGYDQDNQPVVRATSIFRDDLLRFRLIRRKTAS